MATYLTDSWSTVSGLAAVAYGSATRYPEVKNQVKGILGPMLPSTIIEERLDPDTFVSVLQSEYGHGEKFARYIDSQGDSLNIVAEKIRTDVIQAYNKIATYETSLTDILSYVAESTGMDPQRVKNNLEASIPDLGLVSRLATSGPVNKLDKLPAGTRIELSDNVELDRDGNGIKLTTGYLTPADYFSEIAYPGMGGTSENLPDSLLESIRQGYSGYATLQPLDEVLRTGIADIVSTNDIRNINNVSRSVAGLGTTDLVRDVSRIGSLSDADLAMYEFDLTSLVVDINGYTVYDPLTDSSGDYLDPRLLPDYESTNNDPGNGLPVSSRPRSSTFT